MRAAAAMQAVTYPGPDEQGRGDPRADRPASFGVGLEQDRSRDAACLGPAPAAGLQPQAAGTVGVGGNIDDEVVGAPAAERAVGRAVASSTSTAGSTSWRRQTDRASKSG